MNIIYIKNQFQLDDVVKYLNNQEIIAIDTEFMSTTTYYPRVVLLQIASKNNIIIIDTIDKDLNLNGIIQILQKEDILKIMHASYHDLRAIYCSYKIIVKGIFDLQIAAKYCLNKNQISYSELVKKYCDVEILKGLQNSNWSKRPLTAAQIDYAINDVKFSIQIYENLLNQLNSMPCNVIVEYQNDLNKNEEDVLAENKEGVNFLKIKKKVKLIQDFYSKIIDFTPEELKMINKLLVLRDRIASIRNLSPHIIMNNQDIVGALRIRRVASKRDIFLSHVKFKDYVDLEKISEIFNLENS